MTFTIYSVTADDFYYFEYEINGLVGRTSDKYLPNLLNGIINSKDNLVYDDLCSLKHVIATKNKGTLYNGTYIITQLFSRTYTDSYDLKTHIASDLQTALPEHFI